VGPATGAVVVRRSLDPTAPRGLLPSRRTGRGPAVGPEEPDLARIWPCAGSAATTTQVRALRRRGQRVVTPTTTP